MSEAVTRGVGKIARNCAQSSADAVQWVFMVLSITGHPESFCPEQRTICRLDPRQIVQDAEQSLRVFLAKLRNAIAAVHRSQRAELTVAVGAQYALMQPSRVIETCR